MKDTVVANKTGRLEVGRQDELHEESTLLQSSVSSSGPRTNRRAGKTKKGRRANGEGCIYQRSNGMWNAIATLSDGQRKWMTGKTRQIVVEKLKQFQREQAAGLLVVEKGLTVERFMHNWLEQSVKRTNRIRVYELYSSISRIHIVPQLGHIHISKLAPAHVQKLLNDLDDKGKSFNTIRNVRAVLRRSLNYALRQGMVSRNVASLTDLPTGHKMYSGDATKEKHFLTPEQALALLAEVEDHRLELLFRFALELGLRRGELLALRIEDIDLDKRVLRVTGSMSRARGRKLIRMAPKTKSSRRTLPLSPQLSDAIHAHLAALETYKANRIAMGDWEDHGLMFPSERGTPLEPTSLFRHFKRAVKAANLPVTLRFHDLRHSCASLLLAAGVHMRVIMEILGHSEIGTTMNTYAHLLPEVEASALYALSETLNSQRHKT